MIIKSLDQIWDDYETPGVISEKNKKALIWHLENDEDPSNAISMTADMGLKQLGLYLAKYLDHEDDWLRELSVGCIVGRLELAQYTEKAFKMLQNDKKENVKRAALFAIGEILKNPKKALIQVISNYLLQTFLNEKNKIINREGAYYAILTVLDIPWQKWPSVEKNINFDTDVDWKLVEKFKKKYDLQ